MFNVDNKNDNIITFSKGIFSHIIIKSLFGDKLTIKKSLSSKNSTIIGWGNKPNTKNAKEYSHRHNCTYISFEDGFIRSIGLGVQNSPPFSIVSDKTGIYYDATKPSEIEEILQNYDFQGDQDLIKHSKNALSLITENNISKYNAAPNVNDEFFQETDKKRILIIAQTAGDMSLQYGYGDQFSTDDIIQAACNENPDADIYLKVHPDVIAGKKKSDLNIKEASSKCTIISDNVNPVSLLKKFDKVYTKTSQMGFEALLLGLEVVCFGVPFYSGWGLTDDRVKCERRTRKLSIEELFAGAYILYSTYYNPYRNSKSDIVDTIQTIVKYRDIELTNAANLYFFGFSAWKHWLHNRFFKSYGKNSINFSSNQQRAIRKGFKPNARFMLWGREDYSQIEAFANDNQIPVYRVEDGFIRSVSLGSDLTMPYSLVVDLRGVYFDPTCESDLEVIYNTYDFESHTGLLERAETISKKIIKAKLSKYNNLPHKPLNVDKSKYDKIILIPGQVEDDASIRFGGYGMTNTSLIKQAREKNPGSYLIYKPHPDVLAGNRKGHVENEIVDKYCNKMVTHQSIDSCLEIADEVHTISSLSGFDGLLRGKSVVTYGMPFYAGWGLTEDIQTCNRRTRKLTLNELIAGALILYPRYINPTTKEFCEIEVVLDEIEKEQKRYFASGFYRITRRIRDFCLRKVRRLVELLTF